MTSPISSTSVAGTPEADSWALLTGSTSLERQLAVLATLLQRKETDYNRANPTETPKNRITVQPDYEAGQVNMTVDLLISADAVGKSIVDAIVPHIPVN